MICIKNTSFSFYLVVLCFVVGASSCLPESQDVVDTDNSNFIHKVFEYVYAPGQHAMLAKSTDVEYFIGDPALHSHWIYLGGFGGYIIAGFEHDVVNKEGFDFEIYALKGAMPEPAIVYVMTDENNDGLPNERWYELKGNQFDNSQRNYWVRYYKAVNDSSNINWRDSNGKVGELFSGYGSIHTSLWWWSETKTDSITFYGTRLPDSYENQSTTSGQFWTVPNEKFTWGYAENNYGTDYSQLTGANCLDISNAVDSLGNHIDLLSIRFIKVQTAVFQQAGWTNEVSAELRGAKEIK